MTSESKTILSILFKRSGKSEMTFSELYLSLSLELRWFKPIVAKKFIKSAINKNILVKNGNALSPSFDIDQTSIPINFSPSKNFEYADNNNLEKEKLNITDKIIYKIIEKTGANAYDVNKKIKNYEQEMDISFDVAALFFARELNLKIDEYYEGVEKSILDIINYY